MVDNNGVAVVGMLPRPIFWKTSRLARPPGNCTRQSLRMLEKLGRIRLLYILLGVLLLVGLLPLALAGVLLSGRSPDELRSIEGRYQAQLVQDKARQIELYGQRYRDVVTGLARAFEISGGIQALDDQGYDQRLQKTLQEDPNLIALALGQSTASSTGRFSLMS